MDDKTRQLLTKLQLRIYFCSGSYVAFLSSLVQSSKFIENQEIERPFATDGVNIYFNPELMFKMKEEYLFGEFIHTLWHIARLHSIRGKGLNKDYWEAACDIVIDNDLRKHSNQYGKNFSLKTYLCNRKYEGWSEEQIYKEINRDLNQPMKGSNLILLGSSEGKDEGNTNVTAQLLKVQQAIQAARQSAAGTSDLADIIHVMDNFGKSKVNWRQELRQFFVDLMPPEDITWKRPNRRYSDIYLPSKDKSTGKLTHLMYFIDVSGSVTEEQIDLFLNEAHAVYIDLEPEKMTIVSFNSRIIEQWVFDSNKKFNNKFEISRGGGTSYRPIHDMLNSVRPAAAVIFTDLCCKPMEPVSRVPVLWAVPEGNWKKSHQLLTGRIIEIKDK